MRQRRTSLLRDRVYPPIFVAGLPAYICDGVRRCFYHVQPFPAFAGFEKLFAYPCGLMIGKKFCVDYKKVSDYLASF